MRISPQILSLVPYSPGKPISETKRELGLDQVIKLASNESPIPASEKVMKAIVDALPELHRYPDGACYELREAAHAYYGVERSWLGFGNGSDELIDLLLKVYCDPGSAILTSKGAFSAYRLSAQTLRLETIETPLKNKYYFDIDAMVREVQTRTNIRLIFFPNPNNPTGAVVGWQELEPLIQAIKGKDIMLVLDEAYVEFVRAKDYPDGLTLLKKNPQIVVLRTMSKVFGLAGLRLGTLIARPEVVDLFNRVRDPFNVNSLAQVAGIAIFNDKDFINQVVQMTWDGIDYFVKELKKMNLKFVEPQGNFLFFDTQRDAQSVFNQLLKKGLIVRPLKPYGFESELRISVGTPSENETLMAALRAILS